MQTHLKVLGIIYIVWGILGVISILALLGVFVGGGLIGGITSGEAGVFAIAGIFGIIISIIVAITAIPCLLAGYGILKKSGWGRTFGIVISILNLISFPFGTILGIYGLYVLFHEETKRIFAGIPYDPLTPMPSEKQS